MTALAAFAGPPLPIDARLPEILQTVQQACALVLVADPGSGKTTRVPLMLAQAASGGQVWVLQPRRLAAQLAAQHVATGRGEAPGGFVGYQTRLDSRHGSATRLCFMTEGVFLRRLLRRPQLKGVHTVVLDEFHERHLDSDVALMWLRRLQAGPRPDLRLVVMSATLEAAPVADWLGCPALHVTAPAHPVTLHWAEDKDKDKDKRPLAVRVQQAVNRIRRRQQGGHTLVFLPGVREIQDCIAHCRAGLVAAGCLALPLHGRLPAAAQRAAWAPGSADKVIFCTNIAESSLTIDGVRGVVDSGLMRAATDDALTGLPRLQLRPISQASAVQRQGRAGRQGPGHCLRLFSAFDLAHRRSQDEPEMLRRELSSVRLLLGQLGAHAPASLPWLSPPPAARWQQAEALLRQLGALDAAGHLTAAGRQMSALGVHPRWARFLAALPSSCHALAAELVAWMQDAAPGPASELTSGALECDPLVQLEAALARQGRRAPQARWQQSARQLQQRLKTRAHRPPQATPAAGDSPAAPLQAWAAASPAELVQRGLLLAFPDRVAQRVQGRRLKLCQGGHAELSADSAVHVASFAVVLACQQQGSHRRVFAASAIEADWLLEHLPEGVQSQDSHHFDAKRGLVMRHERLTYGDLVLDEAIHPATPGPPAATCLAAEVQTRGWRSLWPAERVEQTWARIHFARAHQADCLAETALPDNLDDFLAAALPALCALYTSLRDLSAASLVDALWARLPPAAPARLAEFAPTHVSLPGRRRVPVHYPPHAPPFIASRLQDFFGLQTGPRIAAGRVPLQLHLLAPNRRAVQVTTDLAGFWQRHYPKLRQSLMRRYPKHAWDVQPVE
ncbi:MAG: ATP-dependent helicase HrpB [Polyangiales bacterium]